MEPKAGLNTGSKSIKEKFVRVETKCSGKKLPTREQHGGVPVAKQFPRKLLFKLLSYRSL